MEILELTIGVPAELRERVIQALLAKAGATPTGGDADLVVVAALVRDQYLYQALYEVEAKAAQEAAVARKRAELEGIINRPHPLPAVAEAVE